MLKNLNKVVQSNKLIEAQYRLTLQEKRLILWLISQIYKDDLDFKRYEISVVEFAKMMEMNPDTQRKELKKITANLVSRLIQIENPHNDETKQLTWLSFARWIGGICYVEFHPELKPYLLQLKEQFTQISFADLIGFKGSYTARILELTAQYAKRGKRITIIEDLKGWCGIDNSEYRLYSNFKAKVIEPAKKEINEKTQYEISYREIKKGNKVVALEWTIGYKTTIEETPATTPTTKKTLSPGDPGYMAIKWDICTIPEMLEFCKIHESTLRRDLIDYLIQVTAFDKNSTTLKLTFSGGFFRDRSETPEVEKSLTEYFKVKNVEFL